MLFAFREAERVHENENVCKQGKGGYVSANAHT